MAQMATPVTSPENADLLVVDVDVDVDSREDVSCYLPKKAFYLMLAEDITHSNSEFSEIYRTLDRMALSNGVMIDLIDLIECDLLSLSEAESTSEEDVGNSRHWHLSNSELKTNLKTHFISTDRFTQRGSCVLPPGLMSSPRCSTFKAAT